MMASDLDFEDSDGGESIQALMETLAVLKQEARVVTETSQV